MEKEQMGIPWTLGVACRGCLPAGLQGFLCAGSRGSCVQGFLCAGGSSPSLWFSYRPITSLSARQLHQINTDITAAGDSRGEQVACNREQP